MKRVVVHDKANEYQVKQEKQMNRFSFKVLAGIAFVVILVVLGVMVFWDVSSIAAQTGAPQTDPPGPTPAPNPDYPIVSSPDNIRIGVVTRDHFQIQYDFEGPEELGLPQFETEVYKGSRRGSSRWVASYFSGELETWVETRPNSRYWFRIRSRGNGVSGWSRWYSHKSPPAPTVVITRAFDYRTVTPLPDVPADEQPSGSVPILTSEVEVTVTPESFVTPTPRPTLPPTPRPTLTPKGYVASPTSTVTPTAIPDPDSTATPMPTHTPPLPKGLATVEAKATVAAATTPTPVYVAIQATAVPKPRLGQQCGTSNFIVWVGKPIEKNGAIVGWCHLCSIRKTPQPNYKPGGGICK